MHHFLAMSDLSRREMETLLDRAYLFKGSRSYPDYHGHTLANLFYENSTRTRVSFELAAQRLNIPVINLDLATSSEAKGETILDTIQNLSAMGIDLFVMRHQENALQTGLAKAMGASHMINAGDGTLSHPSQAMLDVMTILEVCPNLSQCKVAIVGNIRHSRVANSLQVAFKTLGLGQLMLVAPKLWQPETLHYGQVTDNLREGLRDADIVIVLRVQKERLGQNEVIDFNDYREQFAITAETLKYAKPSVKVMHPGPINRGVEIDSACVDASNSLILTQVMNGVFMRMAIIEACLG